MTGADWTHGVSARHVGGQIALAMSRARERLAADDAAGALDATVAVAASIVLLCPRPWQARLVEALRRSLGELSRAPTSERLARERARAHVDEVLRDLSSEIAGARVAS